MRLYDGLLPKITNRIDSILDDNEDLATMYMAAEQIPGLLDAVRRAGAVAGRYERKFASGLWALWVIHIERPALIPISDESPLMRLRGEIRSLSGYLAAKLG